MKRILFVLILLINSAVYGQNLDSVTVKSRVAEAIKSLREFVAIPNNALNQDDITDNIFWLQKQFEKRGFNTAEIPTKNLPLLFAALPMDDAKPTILFYMHLDGQPVDPSKWDQPNPYQTVLKKPTKEGFERVPFDDLGEDIDYDWRLFGRSTADDKGPIVMFLHALDELRANNIQMPWNVKVILDSEEERGSKPLPEAVQQYRDLLEADFLIINDGPMHSSGQPTLIYGCRGITSLRLTTHGPYKPQHSGHYGNYAPNPGFQLAQLLATMKDKDGKVVIPGYYDGIALNDEVQEVLRSVPDDAQSISDRLQFKTAEKVGSFYQESLQYPSLNIKGMGSGWIGKEARTIVPASATVELDLRLVPETNGERLKSLVKEHIRKEGFHIIDHIPSKQERLSHDKIITITEGSVTDAFRTSLDNPYGEFLVKTMQDAFKEDVLQIRIMGGTVPIAPFINELKIPAFIIPLVNADNNQHSPNENLKIGQLAYGITAYYQLLSSSTE